MGREEAPGEGPDKEKREEEEREFTRALGDAEKRQLTHSLQDRRLGVLGARGQVVATQLKLKLNVRESNERVKEKRRK